MFVWREEVRLLKYLGQFSSQKAKELKAFAIVEGSNYMLRFFFPKTCCCRFCQPIILQFTQLRL